MIVYRSRRLCVGWKARNAGFPKRSIGTGEKTPCARSVYLSRTNNGNHQQDPQTQTQQNLGQAPPPLHQTSPKQASPPVAETLQPRKIRWPTKPQRFTSSVAAKLGKNAPPKTHPRVAAASAASGGKFIASDTDAPTP